MTRRTLRLVVIVVGAIAYVAACAIIGAVVQF